MKYSLKLLYQFWYLILNLGKLLLVLLIYLYIKIAIFKILFLIMIEINNFISIFFAQLLVILNVLSLIPNIISFFRFIFSNNIFINKISIISNWLIDFKSDYS